MLWKLLNIYIRKVGFSFNQKNSRMILKTYGCFYLASYYLFLTAKNCVTCIEQFLSILIG